MVTHRAPGTEGRPGPNPDVSRFSESDVLLLPRRWASTSVCSRSETRPPLNYDHYPVVSKLA
eukprot:1582063-Alexandrium_andersonii.AAC.1